MAALTKTGKQACKSICDLASQRQAAQASIQVTLFVDQSIGFFSDCCNQRLCLSQTQSKFVAKYKFILVCARSRSNSIISRQSTSNQVELWSELARNQTTKAMLEDVILFRQPPDSCKLFVTNIPLRPSWDELRLKIVASCNDTLLVHSVRMHTETRTEEIDIDGDDLESNLQDDEMISNEATQNAQAVAQKVAQAYSNAASNSNASLVSVDQSAAALAAPVASTQSARRSRTETRQFKWATVAYYCKDDAMTACKRLNNMRTGPRASRKRSRQPDSNDDTMSTQLQTQLPVPTQPNTQINRNEQSSAVSRNEDRSNRLRARFFRRSRPVRVPPSHSCLAFADCVNVCNYILGFNCWSCSIDEIRPFSIEKGDEEIEEREVFAQQLAESTANKNVAPDTDAQTIDPEAENIDIENISTQSEGRSTQTQTVAVAPQSPSAYSLQQSAIRQSAKARNYEGSYTATVSLHVRHGGGNRLTASACAHSDVMSKSNRFSGAMKGDASSTSHASCKKRAVTNAYRVLFHNLAIVRLADGRCAVRSI